MFSPASPSMLLLSKPLPPVWKNSPSPETNKTCNGEQENGENGTGYEDSSRNNQELSSEGKGRKASLLYATEGDVKKGSLGPPLIPPTRKAVSPVVGSAAGSLHSSLQLHVQESQEMRPRCSSRSKEEDPEHGGLAGSSTKTFSLDTSCVLLPSKSLPPVQKSSFL